MSAAYELAKSGYHVSLYEKNDTLAGLAGSFQLEGVLLEKFYHHWFLSDHHVKDLIHEIRAKDNLLKRSTKTGIFYKKKIYQLSTPLDLLKFEALPVFDRFRLGWTLIRARALSNWKDLETQSAEEWLKKLGGSRVYEVVWKPLLEKKFGAHAKNISATWIWNKLKLRGGSRSRNGSEELAYYKGGFGKLTLDLSKELKRLGVEIFTGSSVEALLVEKSTVKGIKLSNGKKEYSDSVLCTLHYPQYIKLLGKNSDPFYKSKLLESNYLANVCLVLFLSQSLSDYYWLNVSDNSFPFVGVIEHTNFESSETYGGKHIVYLSSYLEKNDQLYRMKPGELLEFSLPHIKDMFPDFSKDWILDFKVFKEEYAQPIITKNYSKKIPSFETPLDGLFLCSMAQIYPEDRGTNYAVREGRKAGKKIANLLK